MKVVLVVHEWTIPSERREAAAQTNLLAYFRYPRPPDDPM